jgi:hypothetical protein
MLIRRDVFRLKQCAAPCRYCDGVIVALATRVLANAGIDESAG